jgi:hypothetical protein
VPKWKVITRRRTGSSHDSAGGFARWSRGIGRPRSAEGLLRHLARAPNGTDREAPRGDHNQQRYDPTQVNGAQAYRLINRESLAVEKSPSDAHGVMK